MRAGFAFFAAAFLIAAPAAAGKLAVQVQRLDLKAQNYEITIQYPRTGNAAIDTQIADWAKAQADWFVAAASRDRRPQDPPYSLDASFTVTRNDGNMFETLFEFDTDTGGAHPNHELHTLNFYVSDGQRLFMAELMTPDGMQRLSHVATDNLIKELTQGDEPASTPDMVRGGTEVHPGIFEAFTLKPDSVVLYFSDYEVAPYASGAQMTEVPIAKLRGAFRDDPRAPAPSFDCEKAATPVEKAICADVALSRLDRFVAQGYYWRVKLAEDDAAKAREKNAETAFLAGRDACASQAGDALKHCVAAAYEARLKALAQEPQ